MGDYLLGIDIGTSAAKCCVIDADGNYLGEAAVEYPAAPQTAGRSERDPEDWYRSIPALVGTISGRNPDLIGRVRAVGVTGQMRGPTFVDGSGGIVRDSILWNDLRCSREVDEIQDRIGGLIRSVTRNPLNTMCTLPKLVWMMREEPDAWEKTTRVIFPKDYIAFRLTGSLQTDPSDASGSSFYDLRGRAWSEEILGAFLIGADKLPPVVPSSTVVGTVTRDASALTGIPEGIPVVAGASDAVTELFAAGISNPSGCKIRLGTSGALSTVTEDLDATKNDLLYVWSYLEPTQWMLDINTRSCAQATDWLRDLAFGGPADDGYRTMEREAAVVPAGAEGLTFHPYLMGEDAPYWDPRLRGSFTGVTARHSRGHFVRAVYEGTAFALRDAFGCLGVRGEGFSEFTVVGGGARNRLWTGIVLDVLGVNGRVPEHAGAALGAAMLAGVGIRTFGSFREAAGACRVGGDIVKHSIENHAVYTRLFERYRTIKEALDPVYDLG
jgi:xylulokinase